ncbi:hypothetical protein GCM10027053_15870 [Intrasporangium mesophilum]
MSEVVAIMSMSLDGYVAGSDDDVTEVFDWYFASGVGVTHLRYPSSSTSPPMVADRTRGGATETCTRPGRLDHGLLAASGRTARRSP